MVRVRDRAPNCGPKGSHGAGAARVRATRVRAARVRGCDEWLRFPQVGMCFSTDLVNLGCGRLAALQGATNGSDFPKLEISTW